MTEARDALCMERSRKREKTGTPKFVDNKRKHLEKNLSASQRDEVFLNVAKEDLQMRQAMVHALESQLITQTKHWKKYLILLLQLANPLEMALLCWPRLLLDIDHPNLVLSHIIMLPNHGLNRKHL